MRRRFWLKIIVILYFVYLLIITPFNAYGAEWVKADGRKYNSLESYVLVDGKYHPVILASIMKYKYRDGDVVYRWKVHDKTQMKSVGSSIGNAKTLEEAKSKCEFYLIGKRFI